MMFLLGVSYGLFKIVVLGLRYGPTSAMLMIIAVLIFMVGLVSEQVAQLRFDRSSITTQSDFYGLASKRLSKDIDEEQ
jgi:hypothetical protein